MNDKNMIEENVELFAVSVNGTICSQSFRTAQAAEEFATTLTEADQAIAEVVPVTSDGLQILLG